MTKRVVKTNLHDVKLAGIRAFIDRRLIALDETSGANNAYRSERGNPCVIGAALSDSDAKYLDSGLGSYSITPQLKEGSVVLTRFSGSPEQDADTLAKLQSAHDGRNMGDLWALLTDGRFYAAYATCYQLWANARIYLSALVGR
jgi:hypothetical protein